MQSKWRYFSDREVEGLHPELVSKLDQARHIVGIPFVITSGKRDEHDNHSVGGAKKSAHLKGLAVDLSCRSSTAVHLITTAAKAVGIDRIGIYIRPPVAGQATQYTHVHLDIDKDPDMPQCVTWVSVCKGNGRIA